ncbi:hypothetical protein RSOLAG1IB_05920 [Rhizoctonia solani AG-1 IB]|uniref:Uncharacterized protein n=1 Tax=Thanatephorus cucumeris (strain AG1-IB / isolate 7/3/14) TaxID=1108050 RepID=A0A0B7F739_THACB|nr:hypothetical protein RSOLAG1IB_05920 [Rhizoctonia solani AG-1 IB]
MFVICKTPLNRVGTVALYTLPCVQFAGRRASRGVPFACLRSFAHNVTVEEPINEVSPPERLTAPGRSGII